MSEDSNDSFAKLVAFSLAVFAIAAFIAIKYLADALHLNMPSAIVLVSGFLFVSVLFGAAYKFELNLKIVAPWLFFIFYLFCIPALNYWSVDHIGDPNSLVSLVGFSKPEPPTFSEQTPAWFGTFWWQVLIGLAIAGTAFFLNQIFKEEY
jgi:hypothetical protein